MQAVHEWRFASWLGYDLTPLEGAIGSQAPADVQRAITERAATLRALPAEVKAERERRLTESLELKGDKKRRRQVSASIGRAAPNERILEDTEIEILKTGGPPPAR